MTRIDMYLYKELWIIIKEITDNYCDLVIEVYPERVEDTLKQKSIECIKNLQT